MAYASRVGRASTSPRNPLATGVCDRCGIWYDLVNLRFQYIWAGPTLQRINLRVCPTCLDVPQEQNRSIRLPADPKPQYQPRPEAFIADSSDYRITAAPSLIDPTTGIAIPQGQPLVTTTGANRITQPTGEPNEVDPAATPTVWQKVTYGDVLNVLSAYGDGNYTVTITTASAHGLGINALIDVVDMLPFTANGAQTIASVPTATMFTYITQNTVPNSAITGSNPKVFTMNVGLPYGMAQYPQTGVGTGGVPSGTVYLETESGFALETEDGMGIEI